MGKAGTAVVEMGTPKKERKNSETPDLDLDSDTGSVIDEVPWADKSGFQKAKRVVWGLVRIVLMLACLYFFICSLGLLEDSFQLLGGKAAGKTFQNNSLLSNPIAGLMIGILATVLVQSSSTSTSIIITMVGSQIIPLRSAIPIIMGANIGTSITNTLVSFAQVANRNEFRRAFAGATVHDMFNWLTVMVLLPLEVASHYLEWLTGLIIGSLHLSSQAQAPDMLKAITRPLTELIVEVDEDVIEKTAQMQANSTDVVGDVLMRWCETGVVLENVTEYHRSNIDVNCNALLASSPLYTMCQEVADYSYLNNSVKAVLEWNTIHLENVTKNLKRCDNLFAQTDLSDSAVGGILLACSLLIIFLALYGIVKILHSLLQGSVAKLVHKVINAELPGRAAYFTGYLAILFGTGMTMVLQSSSIFTSTLTPLVGVGIITVERMYPLTLGSNIGTTVTGILAALSQQGDHLANALQIALCHLFFNVTGIILFYPIPFMRFPIGMAKSLGRTTSKHRWFAIVYIILLFVVLPIAGFGLSVAGWVYLGTIGGSLLFIFIVILIINAIQRKRPSCLPAVLRSWDFLPLWMHSLKPIDQVLTRICKCRCCRKLQEANVDDVSDVAEGEMVLEVPEPEDLNNHLNGHANVAFVTEEHRL